MSLENPSPQGVAEKQRFLRSLPRPILGCLITSTLYLILLECECWQNVSLLWKNHAHISEAEIMVPLMIFLPWGLCTWALRQVSMVARVSEARGGIDRMMQCLAVLPGFAYLLAQQWTRLALAVSKLR
jgi:hypothetical protein